MNLYLRLAWRKIWRHKRRTVIIVLAMSLTLALMMFYDGFMNGFTDVIYGNAVKVLRGNLQVHAEGFRAQVNSTPLLPLADPEAVVEAAESNPQVLAAAQDNGHNVPLQQFYQDARDGKVRIVDGMAGRHIPQVHHIQVEIALVEFVKFFTD